MYQGLERLFLIYTDSRAIGGVRMFQKRDLDRVEKVRMQIERDRVNHNTGLPTRAQGAPTYGGCPRGCSVVYASCPPLLLRDV